MNNFNTHGGHFAPEGYLKVEEGGSHEENPNGGVQLGVDGQGVPNMLEENEPVYDDYVYSDSIIADKEMLKKHNLHEKYAGKKFSEIADIYVDEAEARPLDPISNNGLNAMLVRLADAQEEQKMVAQQRELEDELSNLSPEELSELEAMLSGEQQEPIIEEPVMEEPVAPQPIPGVPMMRNGGPIKIFPWGGSMTPEEYYRIYGTWPDGYGESSMTPEEYARITGRKIVKNVPSSLLDVELTPFSIEDAYDENATLGNEITAIKPRVLNNYVTTTNKPVLASSETKPKTDDADIEMLPTWQRYAGIATSGLLGLYDAFQKPDEYTLPAYTPVLPTARMHLVDPVYNPIDEEMAVNNVLAQDAATTRAIRNSGAGPSTGALLLSSGYNTGRNLGAARTQVRDANNQRRNAVISGINANRQALGTFDYNLSRDRSSILNDAAIRNMQNNLMLQRLNYDAEGQKYAAVSNQIDQVGKGLAGIGNENFSMNMVNTSNPNYRIGPDGKVYYVRKCGGTLLKTIKK